jgi:hypothetical protein
MNEEGQTDRMYALTLLIAVGVVDDLVEPAWDE